MYVALVKSDRLTNNWYEDGSRSIDKSVSVSIVEYETTHRTKITAE